MHWFPGSFLKNFHVSSVTSWCLNIWQVSNPGIEIAITMTSNSFWTNSLACSYKINYCQTFFPIKESKETSAKIYVVWLRFCQTIIKRLNNQTTLLCSQSNTALKQLFNSFFFSHLFKVYFASSMESSTDLLCNHIRIVLCKIKVSFNLSAIKKMAGPAKRK